MQSRRRAGAVKEALECALLVGTGIGGGKGVEAGKNGQASVDRASAWRLAPVVVTVAGCVDEGEDIFTGAGIGRASNAGKERGKRGAVLALACRRAASVKERRKVVRQAAPPGGVWRKGQR